MPTNQAALFKSAAGAVELEEENMNLVVATLLSIIINVEGGYMPTNVFHIYDSYAFENNSNKQIYMTIGAEAVILDFFFIGADIRTECYIRDFEVGGFWPTLENYGFSFGIRPADWIEIGFRHHCIHPVLCYIYNEMQTVNWEGAYEEIYVKIKLKIEVIK